jgi:hypothetical protein
MMIKINNLAYRMFQDSMIELMDDHGKVLAQRDALLAALRDALSALKAHAAMIGRADGHLSPRAIAADEKLQRARAAIAKAEGQS